jgi:hypothetical protein
MPYATSLQCSHLEVQLDVIKQKLNGADEVGVSSDLRDYAIAAAIFLAHAEIENYFVDAIEGVARVYTNGASDAAKLPPTLRAHLICEKFGLERLTSKMVSKIGEQEIFSIVEKWFTSPSVTLLTGAVPLRALTGGDIYGDYSYPSIKNIERVLRRIGIGDPKGTLNREGNRDVVGLLESLAGLRTALAHSATLPGVTVGDVLDRIDGIKLFSGAFDRALYAQTRLTMSRQIWIDAMC